MISARQCKAARDLLDWKQSDLAEKSKMAVSTIAHFERGSTQPSTRTLADLHRAFEDAGIKFIDGNNEEGVKLVK
ncbi:MAG: helix-turn-helix transcriptional regulator [Pseudomonadota bacterium]